VSRGRILPLNAVAPPLNASAPTPPLTPSSIPTLFFETPSCVLMEDCVCSFVGGVVEREGGAA